MCKPSFDLYTLSFFNLLALTSHDPHSSSSLLLPTLSSNFTGSRPRNGRFERPSNLSLNLTGHVYFRSRDGQFVQSSSYSISLDSSALSNGDQQFVFMITRRLTGKDRAPPFFVALFTYGCLINGMTSDLGPSRNYLFLRVYSLM